MKIFDLHCDTFTEVYDRNVSLFDRDLAVNMTELSNFSTAVQIFAVFLRPDEPDTVNRYRDVLQYGKRCLHKAGITVCTEAEHLKCKGIKAMLSVEGCVPGFDPKVIKQMYLDGVRTVSLTWNYDNSLAGGALGEGDLTRLGSAAVEELNRCRMVTDLSHLNRRSFYSAAEKAEYVAATHTGVDAVVPNPRNLTDDQLRVIRDKRGLIGLCIYPVFMGADPFQGFFESVSHCLMLGLEDNIAIGTDFDGAEMSKNLSRPSHLKELYAFLLGKGLEKRLCDKIFFENSRKFYNRVLTKRKI